MVEIAECSRRALDHAVAVANWYDATVTVFYVCAPVPISAYGTVASMMPPSLAAGENQNDVRDGLRTFAAIDGTSARIELEIGEGDAAKQIVAKANVARSDLIVLGTHGHRASNVSCSVRSPRKCCGRQAVLC